ncbi:unnamed protein product [Thlaspi arvense]|uniref:Uncharacterized protein n=1 Tax=Thlaspi arvense TaxID=13288 RepID=A0AAU9S1T6_THLAR|nr:unnamed protein product [Thlaspi arvense]
MDCDGGGSSGSKQHTSVDAKKREKRICHRHTPQQIQRLEAYFKECPHPGELQRHKLCKELNLELDQIKFWFQNKRTQSKVQDERSSNILLRGENDKIRCENEAMLEVLKNVSCPDCGGPPFDRDERERNLHKLRLKNAILKEERDKLANFISKNKLQETMVGSSASAERQQIVETDNSYGANPSNLSFEPTNSLRPPTSQTIQPQPLSEMDITQLTETVASAVEELKRLFFTEEAFWVKSSIDGTYVIDQESYEKFSHAIKHFRSLSARVESSKDVTVVPIEATNLIEMFLDSEKWKNLFPSIVNKATTIHMLGSELPIKENCNVLQVVTWIEHVEVDHKPETHRMYRELLCGGSSGYGAKRWIVTLERMCERMALSSILTIPATDWSEVIKTIEGRRSVMKLGERMLKQFNEMLTMSGKVDFPQHSKCGVRISLRVNNEAGQPHGLVVSAATCLSIPRTPLQVFNALRSSDTRHEWDVLCNGNRVSEIARVFTGSSETNHLTILRPQKIENSGISMAQFSLKGDMVMLQDCYMDALGGVIAYAPLDLTTMNIAASGKVDPAGIQILPSGFTISSDGQRSIEAEDGGTLLSLVFQILISGRIDRTKEVNEKSVAIVSALVSSTIRKIKLLLNCPDHV